ncbi:MAG TPA: hypothetical protein VFF65_12655 [Phycisphaerales bacterium]|nr:hypothetical protein [Phycisphaerales bacterium]
MPELVHTGRMMGARGGRFLPQTQALVAAMTTPPTDERAELIDEFNRSMAAISQASDWLFMLCAHAEQASLLDWTNPSRVLTPVNAPVFDADEGYTGDAVGAYLTTSRLMSSLTKYQRNSASATVAVVGASPVASDRWLGPDGGSTTIFMGLSAGSEYSARLNSNSGGTAAAVNGKGVYTINRNNSSDFQMYKDGVQVASVTTASVILIAANLILLSANGIYGVGPQAYGRVGSALTPTQIAAEAAAVKTFINGCNPGLLP